MKNPFIQKYLDQTLRSANEDFASADGFIDDDMHFTANEDYYSADATAANSGSQAGVYVPKSQPYIITLSNASAASVNNFDVLGAYQYLGNTFTNGSLTISGVTISYAISNVTYYNFLQQTSISPFTVGETYIQSISGTTNQITQAITLNTTDANGNQALKALIPTIDPYQQQTGVLSYKVPFRIDGFTKLTISQVLPSVVFSMQFYPSDNINLARGLSGRNVGRQFGKPGIIRESVAVVGGDTVKARLG